MNYSPPGSSVHGIFQARILKWVAISYFREFSQPRDWTWVSWVSRQEYWSGLPFPTSGDFPNIGIEPGSPGSPVSPELAGRYFTIVVLGKPKLEKNKIHLAGVCLGYCVSAFVKKKKKKKKKTKKNKQTNKNTHILTYFTQKIQVCVCVCVCIMVSYFSSPFGWDQNPHRQPKGSPLRGTSGIHLSVM